MQLADHDKGLGFRGIFLHSRIYTILPFRGAYNTAHGKKKNFRLRPEDPVRPSSAQSEIN